LPTVTLTSPCSRWCACLLDLEVTGRMEGDGAGPTAIGVDAQRDLLRQRYRSA
jgi:hypothetical protein